MLLNIKGMARSTYYYNIKQLRAPDLHEELRERIAFIYNSHKGRYGYRRITLQLREEGVIVNHKTVQKLMGQMSLKAKRKLSLIHISHRFRSREDHWCQSVQTRQGRSHRDSRR